MAETVVGLTIVEECVRAAEIRRPSAKNPSLVRYGEVPLPPGAAGDSEVIDADAVALALRQLWTDAGFSTKRVVLGLGNRRILVRDHKVPALPLEQIRRALPFQVQDMLPVPVEEAVLDFYPVAPDGEDGGDVRGLLVVAVADMISELIDTVAGDPSILTDQDKATDFSTKVQDSAKTLTEKGNALDKLCK